MQENQTRCFLHKVRINSMFVSIQGEGPLVGVRQAFVRFAGCNLNCSYCDTDFSEKIVCDYKAVLDFIKENMPVHSVALTGGEPLLQKEFLKQLLVQVKALEIKVYLETNGTLYENLGDVVDFIDIAAVDVKLPSVSQSEAMWSEHRKFLSVLREAETQVIVKVVLNEKIAEEDIEELQSLVWDFKENWMLVFQPEFSVTQNYDFLASLMGLQKRFLNLLRDVRIIPQVHKLIGVE